MTERQIPDPLDELRRADPAADQLSSASLARVRARVQEVSMADAEAGHAPRRLSAIALMGAGLAAAAIVVAVLLVRPGGPGSPQPPSEAPGMAMCVESYSLETLRHRTFAFDGRVSAINGDEVTFAVAESYRGAPTGELTLTAVGMTGTSITPGGGPSLRVGHRYLVAGDDRFAWACGFTQDYDPTVAAAWADALGR